VQVVDELGAVEVGVQAALLEQRGVGAALEDAAVVDDQDLVGLTHGREPVRDDQAGAALEGGVEGTLDGELGLGVEVRGRLVEDHHGRSLQQQARDGQPLPLAAESR
jgi:hypothetical protein